MKLSKSKLALAKVVNENGGWVDDSANWAVQPKHENGDVWFSTSNNKPYSPSGGLGFTFKGQGYWLGVVAKFDKVLPNWHQCVLSREEYYQAYPKGDDGWIEWKGGECQVHDAVMVDTKHRCDRIDIGRRADSAWWDHRDRGGDIVSCRPHKPEIKPEFCDSVTRSIPDPEAKPTIEQLAQDYRNAKDCAVRLQKEAGEAAVKAEEFAVEIRKKILELQELIGIPNTEKEPELVITNWRDLEVGDLVEVVSSLSGNREGEVGTVTRFDEFDKGREVRVHFNDDPCDYEWCVDWKFIRRP